MDTNHSISCTYIGHATTIIRIGGTAIITDPHLCRNVLIKRRRGTLPIDPGALPELSAVLISHVHYDHLNICSYKYISCRVPIVVPEDSERAIGQYTSNPIVELSHFAKHELADGTEIIAVPIVHRSFRMCPFYFTKSNGYLIRRSDINGAVFFCGDSAYGPHFCEIGEIGKISLALLPIGGYAPRWFMKGTHMTPEEAVRAFEDLRATHMVPIHHGTFRLSMEPLDAPKKRIEKIIEARPDLASRIHILSPGEEFRP